MNRYRLTMLDFPRDAAGKMTAGRPNVVELAVREARNGIAALEAFVAERGVAEHYSPNGRKRLVGLGVPTLEADKIESSR